MKYPLHRCYIEVLQNTEFNFIRFYNTREEDKHIEILILLHNFCHEEDKIFEKKKLSLQS